jgi:hypothetical protein
MLTRKTLAIFVIIVVVALTGFLMDLGFAQETKPQLADQQYVDPKGFFKIVPPRGWKVQEYPEDPRGKVAFLAPDGYGDLRVLINSVDFSTLSDLIKNLRIIEKRISLNTNIQKVEFYGRPAAQRSFTAEGKNFLLYDFLIGNVCHNIQYAIDQNNFNKYLTVAKLSMETYEPIFKKTSKEDVIKDAIAKKLRLAALMKESGNYQLALSYVNEGLELSPKNQDLLKLKKEIEVKK